MIKIITKEVKMPPFNELRFKKHPLDLDGKWWDILDEGKLLGMKKRFQDISLICHNLNKGYYVNER